MLVAEQTKDRHELIDGVSLSIVGRTEEDVPVRLFGLLSELISKAWTQGRSAQERSIRCVRAWSAKEAAGHATGAKVVRERATVGHRRLLPQRKVQ